MLDWKRWLLGASLVLAGGCDAEEPVTPRLAAEADVPPPPTKSCTNCHTGLDNPHPLGAAVSCVDCHGGDASTRPFLVGGVQDLMGPEGEFLDHVDAEADVRFAPEVLADDLVLAGRTSRAFQAVMAAAHELAPGCPGPLALDGSGERVRGHDLDPGQDPQGGDCVAHLAGPNGIDDDGDRRVDEPDES